MVVVLEESAEAFPANNVVDGGGLGRLRVHRREREVANALMRPFAAFLAVVVGQIVGKEVLEMFPLTVGGVKGR